jgi:peptidoglycan/LPS O-acetylase OafA/YrhL
MRPDDGEYRADIDGLRAVAVLAVVTYHAAPGLLPGGFTGVDIFFVISGYLISRIIAGQVVRGTFSYLTFYARRARRIFPALATVLAATLLLGFAVLLPGELLQLGRHVVASALFAANVLLWNESSYFDVLAESKPLLHLWSLGVEEQFYLFWPALFGLLLVRPARWRTGALLLALASLACSAFMTPRWPVAAFYLPITRLWEFLAGALLVDLREAAGRATPATRGNKRLREIAALLGLLAVVASFFGIDRNSPFPGVIALLPVLGAATLIGTGPDTLVARRLLSLRPVVYVGLVSYALYLWHWPLLVYARMLDLVDLGAARALRAGALALALGAAVITYELIERPLRAGRDPRVVAPRVATALAAVAAIGLVVSLGVPGAAQGGARGDPTAWPAEMRSTKACLQRYGVPARLDEYAFCVTGGPARPPQVVLLGDSHANALWPGLSRLAPQRSLLMIGGSSCPYLRGIDVWPDGLVRGASPCPELLEIAYRAARTTGAVVVLAARTSLYTSLEYAPGSPGVHARIAVRERTNPGASPQLAIERALERDLRGLLDAGHRVVLVQQVPELDFMPRNCIRVRPVDRWLPERRDCRIERVTVEYRQRAQRTLQQRVVARIDSPRLQVVDPFEALCDSRYCYAVRDGVLLYRDDHHLSVAGSEFVWRTIAPDVLRTDVP